MLPLIYRRDPTDCGLCFYCGLWIVVLVSSTGICRLWPMDYGLWNYGLWTVDVTSRGFYCSLVGSKINEDDMNLSRSWL